MIEVVKGKPLGLYQTTNPIHYHQKDWRHLRTMQHWMFYPVYMLIPWSTRAHILCLMCTIHQASKWKQDLNEAREVDAKWQTRTKFHQIGASSWDIMMTKQTSSTFWLTKYLCTCQTCHRGGQQIHNDQSQWHWYSCYSIEHLPIPPGSWSLAAVGCIWAWCEPTVDWCSWTVPCYWAS